MWRVTEDGKCIGVCRLCDKHGEIVLDKIWIGLEKREAELCKPCQTEYYADLKRRKMERLTKELRKMTVDLERLIDEIPETHLKARREILDAIMTIRVAINNLEASDEKSGG